MFKTHGPDKELAFLKGNGFGAKNAVIICVVLGALSTQAQVPAPRAPDHPHFATVYRATNENDGAGTFQYGYQTSNLITADANGFIKNPTSPDFEQIQYIAGSFSYYTPDGTFYEVSYTADENGYRPVTKVTRAG